MKLQSLFGFHTLASVSASLLVFGCLTTNKAAWGHGAGGDIALFSTDGQVDVGFAILDDDDITQEFFDPDENVFALALLPLTPNDVVPWQFGSSEPGFDADDEDENLLRDALTPEADITYNLLELTYWDGDQTGGVVFTPAVGIEGGVAPSPQKTFPSGGFHSHPYFGVTDPAGVASDGVYVGKMTVSVDGLADSEPYFMVALLSETITSLATVDEQVAAAEEIGELARLFAEDPVNNPAPIYNGVDFTFFANAVSEVRAQAAVPEPAGLALICSMLLTSGASSRRFRM